MKLIRFRKKLKNSTKIQAILCLNSSPLIHFKNSQFFFRILRKTMDININHIAEQIVLFFHTYFKIQMEHNLCKNRCDFSIKYFFEKTLSAENRKTCVSNSLLKKGLFFQSPAFASTLFQISGCAAQKF